jgi:molybdenum cofactor guanylyltransferase
MSTIAVILAGGLSSRMGQDKALLSMKGLHREDISLLDHIFQQLSQTSVRKTVINRNDNNGRYLPDLILNKGPLSGIHSAAMHYPSDNLLIVPVDLPLIDSLTLETLVAQGNHHQCNVRYVEQSLPLYLNNTDAIRKALDHTLRYTAQFSVDLFCSQFPLIELDVKKKLRLFNANTPEEWQLAQKHFSIHNQPSYQPQLSISGINPNYPSCLPIQLTQRNNYEPFK